MIKLPLLMPINHWLKSHVIVIGILLILICTQQLYAQTPSKPDVDKLWVVIVEGYYFGLSELSVASDGTKTFSKKITRAFYKSPIEKLLPPQADGSRITTATLKDSGFDITYDNVYNCYITQSSTKLSLILKHGLDSAGVKPYKPVQLSNKPDQSNSSGSDLPPNAIPTMTNMSKLLTESKNRIDILEKKLDLNLRKQQQLHTQINALTGIKSEPNSDKEYQFSIMKKIERLEQLQQNHQHYIENNNLNAPNDPPKKSIQEVNKPRIKVSKKAPQNKSKDTTNQKTLSREEIFMRAFGKTSNLTPNTYQAELIVDNQNDKIFIKVDLQNATLEASPLIKALASRVFEDSLALLNDKIQDGIIPFVELKRLGISINEDHKTYICHISLPSGWYQAQSHSLLSKLQQDKNIIYPSAFSGYINARARKRFIRLDEKEPCDSTCLDNLIIENNTKAKPLSANFDASVNTFSVVTEASASYYEGSSDNPFSVYNIRSTKDINSLNMRVTAGEISGKAGSSLHGLSFSKTRHSSSHVNAEKLSDIEFELNTASEVQVFINGRLETILQLPPGEHSISDFPNVNQENRIELLITDHAGKKQTLVFDFLESNGYLSKNKTYWNAAIGFPKTNNILDQRFNTDSIGVGAIYSKDFFKWLTASAGGQYKIYGDHKFSINSLHNFSLATLSFEAEETMKKNTFGWKGRGSIRSTFHRYHENTKEFQSSITWRFSTEYYSEHYNAPSYSHFSEKMLQFATGIGVSLPNATRVGLQLGYSIDRDTLGISDIRYGRSATGSLTKSWGDLSAGFKVSYTGSDIQKNDLAMGANIQYRFNAGSHTFQLSDRLAQKIKETEENASEFADLEKTAPVKEWTNQGSVNWSYTDFESGLVNHASGASASLTPEFTDIGLSSNLFSPWGTVTASYRVIDQQNKYANALQHESSIGAHMGIAWAGTSIGITRPVNGSFALVRGKNNMLLRTVRVNPRGEEAEQTTAYPFFPAVIPTISNHNITKVVVDPDLPLGSLPVENTYFLASGYKSGFEIKVGSYNASIILGTLHHESKKAFQRQIFQVYKLDETGGVAEDNKTITSFTSQSGRFQCPGIVPSNYLIKLSVDGLDYSATIKIIETNSGLMEIGDIVLKTGEPSLFTIEPTPIGVTE